MLMKFVEKTGRKSEFKLFFKTYHDLPNIKFAVIKVSGETLEKKMDLLAEDIAYLNKLGIYPMIVHGAGSVLNQKLPHSKKIDGIRVTSKEDMPIVKEVFDNISRELVLKIKKYGGSAQHVGGVFDCERIKKYGYVGDIKKVNVEKIKKVINKDITPIINPTGVFEDGFLNVNADTAAKELVKEVHPKKFIMLTETGGILDEKGDIISFINLSSKDDFKHITGGMLLKVKEILSFMKDTNGTSIVITSAEDLLKEIFTIKGSGTFIRYHVINSTKDVHSLDKSKIKKLLEDAFGKKLTSGYFNNGITDVFYEKNYEAVAILKKVNGIPYLDKLAVAKFRQGTGLSKSLWNNVVKNHKSMVWRAHAENPFNPTYMKVCDGVIKGKEWHFYWINIKEEDIIPTMNKVISKEKTLV